MGKKIDLTGQKFGRWTVLGEAGRNKHNQFMWNCVCDCGNIKVVYGGDLRNGGSKSCGCLFKHGMHGTPTYRTWGMMLQRCNNPNFPAYENYGGREITVCERWLKFENFLTDMGERPDGFMIERINNNKGYFPKNCCWTTRIEQNRNQRIRKDNKIGIKGVNFCKHRQEYLARISVNKQRIHLGYFVNLKDAIEARQKAELNYWR